MINTKKTIKIIWEYHCFPIWIYDENNELIDTVLPDELTNNIELKILCDNLQSRYDSLFLDNKIEFRYVGFTDIQEQNEFYNDVNKMINVLLESIGNNYNIDIKLPNV